MTLFERHRHQIFCPSWYSIFFNPFFLIRGHLFSRIRELAPNLRGQLIDLGCGAKPYRFLFNVDKYIGVDIEQSGHDHKNENIDVYYDGKTLPFADASLDSVFSSEVFEHVFNLDELLAEIRRVLKPGGQFLVTVPFCWDEHEVPYDFARYTSYGLRHLLEKNGFEVSVQYKCGHYLETLFQMAGLYFYHYFSGQRVIVQIPLAVIFVFPWTLMGLISRALPSRSSFYMSNVVLAKKVDRD
jgi:SAM-dependent methyltransferase